MESRLEYSLLKEDIDSIVSVRSELAKYVGDVFESEDSTEVEKLKNKLRHTQLELKIAEAFEKLKIAKN